MINSELGALIREGKTSREIKKVFKDFTLSKEYFIKQGYKESTAKRYLAKVKINDKNKPEQKTAVKVSKVESALTARRITGGKLVKYLWTSPHANFDRVLLDTSALGYKTTLEIIYAAKEVIIIEAVLAEMDKKKIVTKTTIDAMTLAKNVREYSKKILLETEKYEMVPFKGLEENMYCDDVIIQYMSLMPRGSRVTLLTADILLANKAKMHGFEYIVYSPCGFDVTSL